MNKNSIPKPLADFYEFNDLRRDSGLCYLVPQLPPLGNFFDVSCRCEACRDSMDPEASICNQCHTQVDEKLLNLRKEWVENFKPVAFKFKAWIENEKANMQNDFALEVAKHSKRMKIIVLFLVLWFFQTVFDFLNLGMGFINRFGLWMALVILGIISFVLNNYKLNSRNKIIQVHYFEKDKEVFQELMRSISELDAVSVRSKT